jgi:hypothetical protein
LGTTNHLLRGIPGPAIRRQRWVETGDKRTTHGLCPWFTLVGIG